MPRPFPAHQDQALGGPGQMPMPPTLGDLIEAYRKDYAGYYDRCKHAEFARHARSQSGDLSGAGRRHDLLRARQGDGAHRIGILCQRHQCHARRVRRFRVSRACRSRKPSTSNTGCSKRRSSSACRSRRALPDGSPSSPAAPVASVRRLPAEAPQRRRLRHDRRHRRGRS